MPEDRSLPVPLGRLVASCTFFVSKWLDPDQVRVSEVSPTEFRVKCGKMLTDQEVKGAIVKYLLSKQQRIPPMSARDPLPFDQMHETQFPMIEARDDDEYIETDVEDGPRNLTGENNEDDLEDDEADEVFGFGDGEDEDMEDDEDLDQDYTETEDEPTPEDLEDAEDLEGLDD